MTPMPPVSDVKALNQRFFQAIKNDKVLLQRCNAYCSAKHQKTLVEFLSNGATPEAKATLLVELITIVESGDLSKLPGVPSGQAVDTTSRIPPTAAAPKPAPKAEAPAEAPVPAPVGGNSAVNDLVAKIKAKKEAEARAAAEAAAAAERAKTPALTEERIIELINAVITERVDPLISADAIRAIVQDELNKALAPVIAAITES